MTYGIGRAQKLGEKTERDLNTSPILFDTFNSFI